MVNNNRGIGGIEFCAMVFVLSAAGMTTMALNKDNPDAFVAFRQKKALGYCEKAGTANCKDVVAGMDNTELLAYIKDTQADPK